LVVAVAVDHKVVAIAYLAVDVAIDLIEVDLVVVVDHTTVEIVHNLLAVGIRFFLQCPMYD
jgi:hypothetical protein